MRLAAMSRDAVLSTFFHESRITAGKNSSIVSGRTFLPLMTYCLTTIRGYSKNFQQAHSMIHLT